MKPIFQPQIDVELLIKPRQKQAYDTFIRLLDEIRKHDIPDETIDKINQHLTVFNHGQLAGQSLYRTILRAKQNIVQILEKDIKLVPKNFYRQRWITLGMAVYGMPLGVVLGTTMDNMGLIGAGLPIGMVIGAGVGARLDKKAMEQGNQLDVEI